MVLCYVTVCNGQAPGQAGVADSTQLNHITTNMANIYNKTVIEQSRLYNGPAFIQYPFRGVTNANFKDSVGFNNGTVNYDGIVYTHVPLIYNIDRDVLVSYLFNGFSMYTLLSEKVSAFDLLDHHFIRLLADFNSPSETGFYDELYHDKLWLLARRTKNIQEETEERTVKKYFVPKTYYYLKLKNGTTYYDVHNQGRFLNVLKDKKGELKQYLKNNKIRFKDDPEHAMVMLATYYDHLTN